MQKVFACPECNGTMLCLKRIKGKKVSLRYYCEECDYQEDGEEI